jgi:hypothetical protein
MQIQSLSLRDLSSYIVYILYSCIRSASYSSFELFIQFEIKAVATIKPRKPSILVTCDPCDTVMSVT